MDKALLTVEDLTITFGHGNRALQGVRGVSFSVGREKVGIVGESGSGKSLTGRSILKLIPRSARLSARSMTFDGIDLLAADERRMQTVRGNRISMIMQDPRYSLNPLMRVGDQIAEAYRIHHQTTARGARERALEMLEAVSIRDPNRAARLFPHQISGGMGQRIMIAMMLIPEPDLIIADEPTSALDITVRRQVLGVLDNLVSRRRAGLIFISHDLNLVGEFCDRILVMYSGRIVEELPAEDLSRATHPYTRALLDSLPRLEVPVERLAVPVRDQTWDFPVATTMSCSR